jgi:hypothetical protein
MAYAPPKTITWGVQPYAGHLYDQTGRRKTFQPFWFSTYRSVNKQDAIARPIRPNAVDWLQRAKNLSCRMICAMTGLLCLGKPDYGAIEPFRDNPFFSQSLGLKACPSSPALRQRIDVIGNAFDAIIKEESADLIRRTAPQISPVQTSCGDFVPIDVDVSPFDNSKTSKQGVSRTYKGFDGYSPIFGYIGKEGYLVNLELRKGSQHCQKNTPEFLNASIQYTSGGRPLVYSFTFEVYDAKWGSCQEKPA